MVPLFLFRKNSVETSGDGGSRFEKVQRTCRIWFEDKYRIQKSDIRSHNQPLSTFLKRQD